jgi:hypothetical protein
MPYAGQLAILRYGQKQKKHQRPPSNSNSSAPVSATSLPPPLESIIPPTNLKWKAGSVRGWPERDLIKGLGPGQRPTGHAGEHYSRTNPNAARRGAAGASQIWGPICNPAAPDMTRRYCSLPGFEDVYRENIKASPVDHIGRNSL